MRIAETVLDLFEIRDRFERVLRARAIDLDRRASHLRSY